MGGTLHFSACDRVHGAEVWRSDGTAEGTALEADVSPDPYGSSPQGFIAARHRLFCIADGSTFGEPLDRELRSLRFRGAPAPLGYSRR